MSTALANPRDLSDWLGVKDSGLYNFRPSVRPIPCEVHIQVSERVHSAPRPQICVLELGMETI